MEYIFCRPVIYSIFVVFVYFIFTSIIFDMIIINEQFIIVAKLAAISKTVKISITSVTVNDICTSGHRPNTCHYLTTADRQFQKVLRISWILVMTTIYL